MSSNPPAGTPAATEPDVPRTRVAGLWIASVLFAVVLLLLLIFILQNTQRAEINFFGARANPPVGVALLLAAVFGVLLVALPGTARIVQLRMLARRRRQQAAERAARRESQQVTPPEAAAPPDAISPPAPAAPDVPAAPAAPGVPAADVPTGYRPLDEPDVPRKP